MGIFHFFNGEDAKAAAALKSVHPESQFYPKALFYLGILSTKTRNYKEATFYFEKVVQLAHGHKELNALLELARLNWARSVYSSGDIDRSIELYSQFTATSPYWLTILLEASWPLMRVNDTTVSLGNLQTVLSPFYREDLVGEGYILRATILFSLCKYEEMRQTLSQFFTIYDPAVRAMQTETSQLGSPDAFYRAYISQTGLNRSFINYAKRDAGIARQLKVQQMLRDERYRLASLGHNDQMRRMMGIIDEADKEVGQDIGTTLMRMHKRKMADLLQQREQANYLKVEIVTGEKELVEGQKGLPPKREVEVETSVAAAYHYWPFVGEYWEDELGAYVYTTESACVN
jgi:tetratricopeptide (TPR) repeat protein